MKTEDTVLLIGAAVVAWIVYQAMRAAPRATTTPTRTGTVTAGGMTFGTRPSPYEAGRALVSAWSPSSPMDPVGWDEA